MASRRRGSFSLDIGGFDNPAIHKKKYQETITLHPDSLRNLLEAAANEVDKYKGKWRDMYKGVLLKIRKIKIVGDLGRIHDEYPYIFVDVLYKVLIFRPEKGTALSGNVTQIFPSHISLLVFGLFNAMIIVEDLKKRYTLNNDKEIIDKKTGKKLNIGEEINFIVKEVEFDSEGFFIVHGEINESDSKKQV